MNKGKLPNKCPNCKSVNLSYEDFDYKSKTSLLSQEVHCSNCDKTFKEIFKAIGWEIA